LIIIDNFYYCVQSFWKRITTSNKWMSIHRSLGLILFRFSSYLACTALCGIRSISHSFYMSKPFLHVQTEKLNQSLRLTTFSNWVSCLSITCLISSFLILCSLTTSAIWYTFYCILQHSLRSNMPECCRKLVWGLWSSWRLSGCVLCFFQVFVSLGRADQLCVFLAWTRLILSQALFNILIHSVLYQFGEDFS